MNKPSADCQSFTCMYIWHEYEWVGVCGVSVQAGNILVIEELACVCGGGRCWYVL